MPSRRQVLAGIGSFSVGTLLAGNPRDGITVADGTLFVVDSGGEDARRRLVALE